MEKPVSFRNSNNQLLRGVVHCPDAPPGSGKKGVIFLTSGFGTRTYVHDLYVKSARELCRSGYHVLRFDFHGLGESEGDFEPAMYIELYNDVQNGLFVNDVDSAIEFLIREYDVEDVELVGICGGAITGLLSLASTKYPVKGAVLIGLPITLDSPDRPYMEETTAGSAGIVLKNYAEKLFNFRAWLRLITFRSDYKTIFKSIGAVAKSRFSVNIRRTQEDWEQLVTHPAFNPRVISSLISCFEKQRKIFLVFSEFDRLRWEFESEFQNKCLKNDEEYRDFYRIKTIPGANHEFHFPETQENFVETLGEWLDENSSLPKNKDKTSYSRSRN